MPGTRTDWEDDVSAAMQDCVDTFGQGADQITYTHLPGGTPYTLDGIFESESIAVDPETGARVISNIPQVSFRLDQLEDYPKTGDTVVINDITYRVKDPTHDGQGTVTCRLWRK